MPGGRKPRSDVLVYEGRRYTWSYKGYWRCTTGKDRHNLARRIWEAANGVIPAGCKIVYLDGNRYNLDAGNLACFTHAEFQRSRLRNTDYRAINECQLTYGRLLASIMNKTDTAFRKDRYQKVIDTRRRRYGPSMGNVGRGKGKMTPPTL